MDQNRQNTYHTANIGHDGNWHRHDSDSDPVYRQIASHKFRETLIPEQIRSGSDGGVERSFVYPNLSYSDNKDISQVRYRRISQKEWDLHRAYIHEQYVVKNQTLLATLTGLRTEYGFRPSPHQFDLQVKKWGFSKKEPRGNIFRKTDSTTGSTAWRSDSRTLTWTSDSKTSHWMSDTTKVTENVHTDEGYVSKPMSKTADKMVGWDFLSRTASESSQVTQEQPSPRASDGSLGSLNSVRTVRREELLARFVDQLLMDLDEAQLDFEDVKQFTSTLPSILSDTCSRLTSQDVTSTSRTQKVATFIEKNKHLSELLKYSLLSQFSYDEAEPKPRDGGMTVEEKMERYFSRDEADLQPDMQQIRDERQDDPTNDDDLLECFGESIFADPAYKWLLDTLNAQLLLMKPDRSALDMISSKVVEMLGYHTGKEVHVAGVPMYKVKVSMDWPLRPFVESQKLGISKTVLSSETESTKASLTSEVAKCNVSIASALTITGKVYNAEALTCIEYVRRMWPQQGVLLVNSIDKLLRLSPGSRVSCCYNDGTSIEIREEGSHFTANINGTNAGVTQSIEQLAWLGTTFRNSPFEKGLIYCKPSLKTALSSTISTSSGSDIEQTKNPDDNISVDHTFSINFHFSTIPTKDERVGSCWIPLFLNHVMVTGYPVSPRPYPRLGLEISLDKMVVLLGTDCVNTFGNHIFIKAFSAMLVPVDSGENTVIWHLQHNKPGERMSYRDHGMQRLYKINIDQVKFSRHIIGWCRNILNYTGAPDAQYHVRNSDLEQCHAKCVLDRLSVSGGQYLSVAASVALWKRDQGISISCNDMGHMLQNLAQHFILFWDVEDNRGWLVDGIKALLHLSRASLKHSSNFHQDMRGSADGNGLTAQSGLDSIYCFQDGDLKESPEPHDSNSAYLFLTSVHKLCVRVSWGDIADEDTSKNTTSDGSVNDTQELKFKYSNVFHRIKLIYSYLEKIIDHQEDVKAQDGKVIKFPSRRLLEGWDFFDLISMKSRIHSRVTDLPIMGTAWVDLLRALNAVTLFGKGFGELIKPKRIDTGCCSIWSTLPKHNCYIATSVTDLKSMMRYHGNPDAKPKVLCKDPRIIWHVPSDPFHGCGCDDKRKSQRCKGKLIQVPWPTEWLTSLRKFFDGNDLDIINLNGFEDGAIIFGYNGKIKLTWGDEGAPREHGPSPSPATAPLSSRHSNMPRSSPGAAEDGMILQSEPMIMSLSNEITVASLDTTISEGLTPPTSVSLNAKH